MTRSRLRWLGLLAVALTACQSYQFTPVGRCLLQPGRVSVAVPAAVDILFVIDDSLSMDKIQASLASNLGSFIDRLAQAQRDRVAAGKDPLDFYVAVTTTSVLVNRPRSGGGYDIVTSYYNFLPDATPPNCALGVSRGNGTPYPAGDFVAAGSNPTVLAFTKDLDWLHASTDATIQGLMTKFRANVQVGSCGANQEMPFEAARLAIQKALAGEQRLPSGVAWPHSNSRLVLVFVGNEDDCSTPRVDAGGLGWDGGQAGVDVCDADAQRVPPLKLYPDGEYVSLLKGLGRPLGVAFVRPGFSDCTSSVVKGTRMHGLAADLQAAGAATLEASVCGDFSVALSKIAGDLAVPDHLDLPSTPAEAAVTRLVIEDELGKPVHVCEGPGTSTDPKEWWFVGCSSGNPSVLPVGQTDACVQLKGGGACEPRPGQTLVAEYLGRVPVSGCLTNAECANVLGGAAADWRCEIPTGSVRGSCLCAAEP